MFVFLCDEKYMPNHQCSKKYLHSIMVQECSDDEEPTLDEYNEGSDTVPLILINAMMGLMEAVNSTMRLIGYYKK